MAGTVPTLRTRVYIDGYNLYYGCLKGTALKWLDVQELFRIILPTILYEQNGTQKLSSLDPLTIKYFTAPILKNFARGADSVPSQVNYHQALKSHLGSGLKIIKGYFDTKKVRAHLYVKGQSARDSELKEIWKIEEKQSDVALALHAYSDVTKGEVDQVVLVTNDTDHVPTLKMLRDHTTAVVGLVVPIPKHGVRRPNKSLTELAHWTRNCITEGELKQAQLPSPIRLENRVIHKPISWYPRPDLLKPVFIEAKRVTKSKGAAWKWLKEPCERLAGRVPIEMAENDEEVKDLVAYQAQYAREFNV